MHPTLPFKINPDTGKVWIPSSPGHPGKWTLGSQNKGYMRIRYNYKTYLVHRLVAEACIPNPENKPVVDHINRNRADNRACNLRWATKIENSRNCCTCDRCFDKYGIHMYEDLKDYRARANRRYYEENKDKIYEQHKEYNASHREQRRISAKKRYHERMQDPEYRERRRLQSARNKQRNQCNQ